MRAWDAHRFGCGGSLRDAVYARLTVTDDGCWLSKLKPNTNYGYSRFNWNGRRMMLHIASWRVHRGDIPAGLKVLHRCDVPACANPNHLFLGTLRENTLDMFAKGRANTPRGERSGHAKLTEQQARAILADTRMEKDIAADYGVAKSTVGSIKQRRNWAHVEL